MEVLKTIAQILYIAICIVLTVVVLKQESKSAGLSSALTGASESYWSKNRGRSAEGILVKITRVLAVLFIVIAVVLNLNW